ncbi:MAG: nickel-dependent lactate racemase [Christensenellales bacterium]
MNVKLGFDKTYLDLVIPDGNLQAVLVPNDVSIGLSGGAEVRRALRSPIGSPLLGDIVKKDEKVCIVTSDITRPMPSKVALPPVLDELEEAGVPLENIRIVLALGCHRCHTEQEMRDLVGDEVFESVEVLDGDPSDCVHLGTTKFGTPVDICRSVAECDRIICMGNIEYHYFAGYSGGAKAIMPGVSTRDAIQNNHSKMVLPEAKAGSLKGNPVREDIDSVVDFLPIDFIVNVVLDERKNIIKAVAGDYQKAHLEGCAFLDSLYKVNIKGQADIVVVSAGGYPKDINLYQAQKALDNAGHAVKEGGIIIWVASCKEMFGEHVFEEWITKASTPQYLIEEIQRNFQLGGHKAAAIAMILERANVLLVSDLEDELAKSIFLEPYASLQEAFDDALAKKGKDAKVIVMPYGGSTLPFVVE